MFKNVQKKHLVNGVIRKGIGVSVHIMNNINLARLYFINTNDAEGRKKLAGTMLRALMSLQKMTYDAATGTVIYRSKMHAGLKRNFQVMSGAARLDLLCRHIPDRYEHLVRYAGWYSNRARGARAKNFTASAMARKYLEICANVLGKAF